MDVGELRKDFMILGATGHRLNKLGGYNLDNPLYISIKARSKEIIEKLQPEKIVTGMALGFDMLIADLAIELNIPFLAAVPFVGQESVWPNESKERYNKILEKASEIIIVSKGGYAAWKLQKRNEYMVDVSNVMLACFDGSIGGTNNCITYTNKQNKEIIIIDPKDFQNILT